LFQPKRKKKKGRGEGRGRRGRVRCRKTALLTSSLVLFWTKKGEERSGREGKGPLLNSRRNAPSLRFLPKEGENLSDHVGFPRRSPHSRLPLREGRGGKKKGEEEKRYEALHIRQSGLETVQQTFLMGERKEKKKKREGGGGERRRGGEGKNSGRVEQRRRFFLNPKGKGKKRERERRGKKGRGKKDIGLNSMFQRSFRSPP